MIAYETECRRVRPLGCCVSLCLILLLVFVCVGTVFLKKPSPHDVFRKYVLNPVPASVTFIRAYRPSEFSGHRYTLHFDVSRTDLDIILNSRPFKEVKYLEYHNGHIVWEENSGLSHDLTVVFNSGKHRPGWFRPELWNNPKAYAFQEKLDRKHIQLLLYNEKLNQVYFIEYKEGH